MSEVCSNVLKVISNAYYATLPVKEVGALILVLGDISSSAVSSGVTVYSPWHFRTCEFGGQCDTGLWEKDYQILVELFSPTTRASTQIGKYVRQLSQQSIVKL
jgi:hypothetical protein